MNYKLYPALTILSTLIVLIVTLSVPVAPAMGGDDFYNGTGLPTEMPAPTSAPSGINAIVPAETYEPRDTGTYTMDAPQRKSIRLIADSEVDASGVPINENPTFTIIVNDISF